MYSADMVSHQSCFRKVGSPLQSHGKRVQSWPVGFCLTIVLNAVFAELLGDGRDDATVKSAT